MPTPLSHPKPNPENEPDPAVDGLPELYGLILAGGHSSRMGQEKALLNYGGQAQGLLCWKWLSSFCEKVFLSCRAEQWEDSAFSQTFKALPTLIDAYPNIGPMAGLLTPMETYPRAAWLVLACDMPLVDESVLSLLVAGRNFAQQATVFSVPSSHDNDLGFEPLCAIYEPSCLPDFQLALQQGRTGLQGLLVHFAKEGRLAVLPASIAMPNGQNALQSLNTPEEAERFRSG